MKKRNIFYSIIFLICFLLSACNLNNNNDIDSLIVKNELKWGMNYKTVKKVLDNKYGLTFIKKEQINDISSFIFLGGSINGIKMKGIKFLFQNDSVEGMDIWIDSNTNEEMNWKYSSLSKYFSNIGEIEFNASNDAWRYCTIGNDGEKKCDTDIFMLPEKNKILVHVHRTYVSKESIFIY